MSNVRLPNAIHETIKNKYPDWKITGDQAVIRNFDEDTKYYQVTIESQTESKNVFFNSAGKSIRVPRGALTDRKAIISKEKVPKSVVTAIETDFLKCKENISWRTADKRTIPDHYVAKAKGKNYTCEAVYDKNGKLIRSKTIMTNIALPAPVRKALTKEHAGWKMTGDKAVIRNFDDNTKYFEIYLEKEGEEKTVHYNALGKKVKPRRYTS